MLRLLTTLATIFAPAQPSIAVHATTPWNETDPSAAFSDRGLLIAWVAVRPSHAEVMYSFSEDLSALAPANSVSGPTGATETIRAHAAANGERAVIVWADASSGDHDVYAAISGDGGRTFAPPLLVAGGDGGQLDPRAAVLEDGTIAVVFHDSFGSSGLDRGLVRRIRVAIAPPLGSFGPAKAIGVVDSQAAFDLFPAIAATTSTISVAWLREYHDRRAEIYLAESFDSGATFDDERAIDSPMFRVLRPRIAPGAFVVWDAISDGEYLNVFTRGRRINITDQRNQMRSDVAVFEDRAIVAWLDHSSPGVRKIVVRENDGGEQVVSEMEAEVEHPAVAVRADAIVIVFQDAREGSWDVRATILR